MRATITVPDELWQKALAASTVGTSASAIIQDALARVTANQQDYQLDEEDKELLMHALATVAQSANNFYANGYKRGLRLANELGDWTRINQILKRGLQATLERVHERALAERGKSPSEWKELKSPFVRDERFNQEGSSAGDGWCSVFISAHGDDQEVEVLASGADDLNPLMVKGTHDALREVLRRVEAGELR